MKIFLVVWLTIATVSTWQLMGTLSSVLQSNLPANLSDFGAWFRPSTNQLVIFGGDNEDSQGTQHYHSILEINMNTYQSKASAVPFAHKTSDTSQCPLLYDQSLYIYQMYGSSDSPCKFHKINLNTKQNKIKTTTLSTPKSCSLIANISASNQIIFIMQKLVDNQAVLQFHTIDTGLTVITPLPVRFKAYRQLQVQQWDATIKNVNIRVQQLQEETGLPIFVDNFTFNQGYRYQLVETGIANTFYIVTDFHSYTCVYNKITHQLDITFDARVGFAHYKRHFHALRDADRLFFGYLNTDMQFLMSVSNSGNTYDNIHVFNNQTPYFYSQNWPDLTQSSGLFSLLLIPIQHTIGNSTITDLSILLLAHKTLQVYRLSKNVFYSTSTPSTVVSSYFGLVQCQLGWSGRNCSHQICPNSLILRSQNGTSAILFECSGHGKCTSDGCYCDQNWGGDDCSIYMRKKCKGTLLQQFPLSNCECFSSTVGGNSCQIIYCPNDCTGNGVCVDGKCQCTSLFAGADCSILVVGFPS